LVKNEPDEKLVSKEYRFTGEYDTISFSKHRRESHTLRSVYILYRCFLRVSLPTRLVPHRFPSVDLLIWKDSVLDKMASD